MTLCRPAGQGTTVMSHLPHPSAAEPSPLPSDSQRDVSSYTAGPEGCSAWARLAWASVVIVGTTATWQNNANDMRQRGQTHGPQRQRDFFGVRRYRRPARQGIQRVV